MDLKDEVKKRRESGNIPSGGGDLSPVKDESAFIIPVHLIDVRPQARKTFEEAEMDSFAKSIQEKGQIEPILVKKLPSGRYELIAGERRLRAIRDNLKERTIKATVKEGEVSELDTRLLQLVENKQRADYEPLELAKELAEIKSKYDLADATLAEMLGVVPSWIYKIRSLNDAPEHIKERIRNKTLAPRTYLQNKKTILAKKTRQVLVKVPYGKALELTRILQKIAEKSEGLEPITLPKKPQKDDLLKILTERATEILSQFEEKT